MIPSRPDTQAAQGINASGHSCEVMATQVGVKDDQSDCHNAMDSPQFACTIISMVGGKVRQLLIKIQRQHEGNSHKAYMVWFVGKLPQHKNLV